jgi:SAM-dependent methyltransferase
MEATREESTVKEPVTCPVCRSLCERSGSCYSAELSAAHFCPPERDANRYRRLVRCIDRLWEGEDCCIFECSTCGFAFGVPFRGGDEEFYGILHEQHGYPAWRWDYDLAMKLAIRPRSGGKVLDIGAGTGLFLRGLPRNWSLHGVEGSPTTRSVLAASGIKVFESLQQANFAARGTFHLITLFQVLEHIAEFREVLLLCESLLVPGGMIVISVPEAGAMRRQEEIIGCADMPPNHINKWTPRSLTLALQNAGFKEGKVFFEPGSLKAVRGAVHLQILSDRKRRSSLANRVYRIRNRRARIPLLVLLALPAFVRLIPYLRTLCRRTAFGIIGTKRRVGVKPIGCV